MRITEEQIQEAEKLGACSEALGWLREKSRTWYELAEHNHAWLAWDLTRTQFCPSEDLEKLSNHPRWSIRMLVAQHPNTSNDTINHMSNDNDEWVLEVVAKNPNLLIENILKLSKHISGYIRFNVANNKKTPSYILDILSKDKYIDVKLGVIRNKNTSIDTMTSLAKDPNDYIRSYVAGYCSEDLFSFLLKDNQFIRRGLARNPLVSKDLLNHLLNDDDEIVREIVNGRLKYNDY